MTNASVTPGSRPRRGVIGVLALLGAGALTAGIVLAVDGTTGRTPVAGAVELDTFASCDDLAAWGAEALGLTSSGTGSDAPATTVVQFDQVGGAMDDSAPVAAAAESDTASSGGSARAVGDAEGAAVADGTNVAVEGVDEVDLVDRLTDDVALVTSSGTLAVVDLAAGEVVARATVAYDAQVTYDGETGVVWVVGSSQDGSGVLVERFAVTTASLEREGGWSTSGALVDARRVGAELHVVATEGFGVVDPGPLPVEPVPVDPAPPVPETTLAPVPETTEPELTEPEPAEPEPEVTGPEPAEPEAPETPGPGEAPAPVAPDEVVPVGSDGADRAEPSPPAVSVPFQDGPVDCTTVLHPEGPADPSATLLVTLPATGDVAPVRSAEVVGSGQLIHVTTSAIYLATPQWTDDGPVTGIHRFDLATLQPTGSGSVEGSLLDEFSMSEDGGVLRVATTQGGGVCCFGRPIAIEGDVGIAVTPGMEPSVAVDEVEAPVSPSLPEEGLNEIVVLDTEGALEQVGRTEPFGKPGETLHGIRFAGATAYAVTFLQTDPFYVVDLSTPSAPRVVGEVELPGFSSYLHPLGDGLVVGFGPDGEGRASAKLFDVSDPTAPSVVDDLALGDDSPVQYDHHAFVDRGEGRFAVPTASYSPTQTSSVVVVDTSGGRLDVVEEISAPTPDGAVRAIPVGDDGDWALLGYQSITLLGEGGGVRGTVSLTS